MKKIVLVFLILTLTLSVNAKTSRRRSSRQNISLSPSVKLEDALTAIEALSQQFKNKKIINSSTFDGNIKTPVNNVNWEEALKLITGFNKLELIEMPGAFVVQDLKEKKITTNPDLITLDTEQVLISAIFLKADRSEIKNLGIDWTTLSNGKVVANANFSGAKQLNEELFAFGANTSFNSGNYTIDVNTLLKTLEANKIGDILAKPNITVLSGKEGYIQVGEDFSVKQTDESGNISDEFFSTGIILNVKPKVISENGQKGIYLKAKVEKSTAQPGQLSTIIRKNQSETEIVLYDGEQTVVGGLYESEIKNERGGVPFLKDLPGWFFGLRYIFGYQAKTETNTEMIVIIKAEILEKHSKRKQNAVNYEDTIKNLRKEANQAKKLLNKKGSKK